MNLTRRTARLGIAAAVSGLLGTGVTVGAFAVGPPAARSPALASAADGVTKSYPPVLREVVHAVVLIRAPGGPGSGIIFGAQGDVVTNAHVASFQVQLAGDPAPRPRT